MSLHDRVAGTTVRLSVGPGGSQFIGPSRLPRISANDASLTAPSILNAAESARCSIQNTPKRALSGTISPGRIE